MALIVVGLALLLATGAGALIVLRPTAAPEPSLSLPSVGPPPTKAPGAEVTAAMWKLIGTSAVSYHLETSGTVVAKAADKRFAQKFTLAIDIAGDDYVGTLAFAGGKKYVWDRFQGTVYARVAGTSKWSSTPTFDRAFRQSPFMGLDDQRELAYGGSFVEKGITLHRLVSTEAYRPSVARMLALARFDLPFLAVDVHLELIVTDEGVPVRATFSCKVAPDPEKGIIGFSGSAKFSYSKFGQGPKITAPPTH